MAKSSVMFLCTGNSCRSQMAEAFLRHLAGDEFDVYSAGLEPADWVNPLAVRVMKEIGIDISDQKPKALRQYLGRLSVKHVIIVCHSADRNCPRIFPGALERHVWPFEDPAAFVGSEHATLEVFRKTRDQIRARIESWLAEYRRSKSA